MYKQDYFQESDRSESIRLILDGIRSRKLITLEDYLSKNCALLILDMQEYFFDSESHAFVPASKHIVDNIKLLQESFEIAGHQVIFTKHQNSQENSGMMGNWWKELMLPENNLTEIAKVFDRKRHKTVIKSRYDAFHSTDLNNYLAENEIETVVCTGVMTHLCCENTARSAFNHGFNVVFPIDTTATYNLDLHIGALKALNHGYALTPDSKSVLDTIRA